MYQSIVSASSSTGSSRSTSSSRWGAKKPVRVIDKVKAFEEASRRGEYYESFNVNSKNFMDKSEGTEEWIAECERLLEDLLGISCDGDPAEAREAFELLFGLLRRIDEGEDDIIFFADEAGSWQVGVDWPKAEGPARVLPVSRRNRATGGVRAARQRCRRGLRSSRCAEVPVASARRGDEGAESGNDGAERQRSRVRV